MKPDADRLLEIAATELVAGIAPALPTPYQQSNAAALGALLAATREELDRGVARRVEENAALRVLFADAQGVVGDAGLRGRLEQAARDRDENLTLGALERANGALRGLLVELHAHVETLTTPAARRLDEAIWSELVASTERRKLSLALF